MKCFPLFVLSVLCIMLTPALVFAHPGTDHGALLRYSTATRTSPKSPPMPSISFYAFGFILATALLLLTGVISGRLLTTMRQPQWLQACGGAIAAMALLLAID